MPRSVTPKHKTRWVVFDLKNVRLYSWIFFPTKKDAQKWIKKEFRNEIPDERPSFYPRKDWERRKHFFENHIAILRARWHVSRYDALQFDLVETKDGELARTNEEEGD